jgi:hypothetical protein
MRPLWPEAEHGGRSVYRIPLSALSWIGIDSYRSLGLSVHMNQVHKETLSHVENALPNRQSLDVEIFGMEGVPEEVREQHKQRIHQNYWAAQDERFKATGNPPPGQERPSKKIRVETPEELKKRFAEFRAKKAAGIATGTNGNANAAPASVQSPAQNGSPGAFVSTPRTRHQPDGSANMNLSELPLRSSTILPTAWLSELPARRRRSCCWLPTVSSFLSSGTPTKPASCTEPPRAARLPGWHFLPRPARRARRAKLPCCWWGIDSG